MSDWDYELEDINDEPNESENSDYGLSTIQEAGLALVTAGVQIAGMQRYLDWQQSRKSDPEDFGEFSVIEQGYEGNRLVQVPVRYDRDFIEINSDTIEKVIDESDAVGVPSTGDLPWKDEVLSAVTEICEEKDVPVYVTDPNNALTASSDAMVSGLGTYALLSGLGNIGAKNDSDVLSSPSELEASRRDILRLGAGALAYGTTTTGQGIRNMLGDPTAENHDVFDRYGLNHTDVRAEVISDALKQVSEAEGDVVNLSDPVTSKFIHKHLLDDDILPKEELAELYGDQLDPVIERYVHQDGEWRENSSIRR